jgi:iron complex transport system ATP-binding protein
MSSLAVNGLTVQLGGRAVVEDLALGVAPGEWTALIGPNGAGKTTTLRAIAGLVGYRGTVRLGGKDAESMCGRERARRVAVVPQIPVTPPDMTVADYVLLGRTPHISYFGQESRADRHAAQRAIDRLDLVTFTARAMGSLSGGERQRVVLARALAQEADVVLLDEPTSALDLARQQQVLDLVDCLCRQDGLAVLSAMHDLTSAALYCDQVVLMSHGRAVASGPPREVLTEAKLGSHFGVAVRVVEHNGDLLVVPARAQEPSS